MAEIWYNNSVSIPMPSYFAYKSVSSINIVTVNRANWANRMKDCIPVCAFLWRCILRASNRFLIFRWVWAGETQLFLLPQNVRTQTWCSPISSSYEAAYYTPRRGSVLGFAPSLPVLPVLPFLLLQIGVVLACGFAPAGKHPVSSPASASAEKRNGNIRPDGEISQKQ
ncbi:hypothetical protein SLEP1_g15872 [Rubroshorea leprosula]|uniref:Uncharacterized protein n=1 Tax=Rubroshorea leprosula TaxID=152421 RepID=A0AAV5IXZ7_9ROSI|nr:hypothetical protein SLEP1_g15872 [Rubroshorea leprosula]